jgi:membrane-associated phospholipid phosphatase
VSLREAVDGTDERVARWARGLPTSWRPVMWLATWLGYPAVQATVLVLVSLLAPTDARLALWVAAASLVVPTVLKHTWQRKRPASAYVEGMVLPSPSFPSGHAFSATVALGLLAYLAVGHVEPVLLGVVLAGLLVLWGLTISLSRLYFEAHFATDVLGGWLIGAVVLVALVVGFRP